MDKFLKVGRPEIATPRLNVSLFSSLWFQDPWVPRLCGVCHLSPAPMIPRSKVFGGKGRKGPETGGRWVRDLGEDEGGEAQEEEGGGRGRGGGIKP